MSHSADPNPFRGTAGIYRHFRVGKKKNPTTNNNNNFSRYFYNSQSMADLATSIKGLLFYKDII